MATPNLQLIFQALLSVTNQLAPNAPQTISMDFENPTMGGTQVFYDAYFQATTAGIIVTQPAAVVFAVLVQNQSPSANLNVSATAGNNSQISLAIGPGGVFIIFDPTESGAGIKQLSLQGVGGTVPAAVLMGY